MLKRINGEERRTGGAVSREAASATGERLGGGRGPAPETLRGGERRPRAGERGGEQARRIHRAGKHLRWASAPVAPAPPSARLTPGSCSPGSNDDEQRDPESSLGKRPLHWVLGAPGRCAQEPVTRKGGPQADTLL